MLTKNLTESVIKFIYSEKATKFCEISNLLLTGTTQDKSEVDISQNFVFFSEYMNFINKVAARTNHKSFLSNSTISGFPYCYVINPFT